MKPLFSILLIGALASFAFAAEPTAKTLKRCPTGHATLKDVPIVYGLPSAEKEAARKWEEGIAKLEFVPGGCVKTGDSPKHHVICTTCRFEHVMLSRDQPDSCSWTRSSPDIGSFLKPISDLVKSFPVPAAPELKGEIIFDQTLSSDRFELVDEGVNYSSTAPVEKLKSDISAWLKANKFDCELDNLGSPKDDGKSGTDMFEWKNNEFSVSVMLIHPKGSKVSNIIATFFKGAR